MAGVFQAPIFVYQPPQPVVVSVAVVEAVITHLILALQAVNKSATI
jgi:hypothetical protein